MKKENLILLTNNFPYGKGEEFLETEIKYLASKFEKIIIITNNPDKKLTRNIPSNTKLYSVNYKKNPIYNLASLKFIFNKMFWKELGIVKSIYRLKLNYPIVKRLISTLHFGNIIKSKIYNVIRQENININNLVLYSYWWGVNAYAISLIKEKNDKVKVISRAHGGDLYFERHSISYLPMKKFMLNHLDKLFMISDHGKNYLLNKYTNIDDEKIKVSRLGILNNYSKSINSIDDTFKLVSCSFVSSVKRIGLIIEALSMLEEIKVKWTHIGDGEDFEKIKNKANNLLNNNTNIEYEFKGYMDNLKIYKYYENNEIDFFINVSSSEGIPVSMMEALSFSIPIIGTDVGGVSEIVNNNNGYLLSSNPSAKNISEVIYRMHSLNLDEIKEKRKNAYETWLKKYNADKNYLDFVNEIDN